MSKHLKTDLENLQKMLLYLAAQVEGSVRKSVSSLLERRRDLAKEVIEGDLEIDRKEVLLEEECLKVLALHQPVATDLRFVAACLKIDNDLERIGDLACNVAERAISLMDYDPIPVPNQLTEMMEISIRMLRDALDAFVKGDAKAARRVCLDDEEVDIDNREAIAELIQWVKERPHGLAQGIQLVSVSKALERIADHATNIAEDVVYMVEGEIIRHSAAPGRDS